MNKYTYGICLFAIFLSSCATDSVSDRCLTYTISGDSVAWSPTKFYQSESQENQLYIEIPKSIGNIPTLEILDTEFDQTYKINYSFDNETHRYKVEDNHNEYILYRQNSDGLQKDTVYITCNRHASNQ